MGRILLLVVLLSAPAQAQRGKAAFDEGMRLMRANKPAQAEAQFERAIAADERNGLYHLWLGNAVGQQAPNASTVRQPFMARRIKAEYERAVALDPELLDAREGLINFYMFAPGFMGGDPAKAREQQRAIAVRNAYRGHLAAATIATFSRDTVGTERALRAAIAAAPDSVRPIITYAFFGLYFLVKCAQFHLLLHPTLPWQVNMTMAQALVSLWTEEDIAIFSAIMAFWFGQRALMKAKRGI